MCRIYPLNVRRAFLPADLVSYAPYLREGGRRRRALGCCRYSRAEIERYNALGHKANDNVIDRDIKGLLCLFKILSLSYTPADKILSNGWSIYYENFACSNLSPSLMYNICTERKFISVQKWR